MIRKNRLKRPFIPGQHNFGEGIFVVANQDIYSSHLGYDLDDPPTGAIYIRKGTVGTIINESMSHPYNQPDINLYRVEFNTPAQDVWYIMEFLIDPIS